jgi:hypothetical protein
VVNPHPKVLRLDPQPLFVAIEGGNVEAFAPIRENANAAKASPRLPRLQGRSSPLPK